METVFEIASRIGTPLSLAGLFAVVFFLILKQIIEKLNSTKRIKQNSTRLIKLIIHYAFIIALLAMCLGFLSFVISLKAPSPDETVPGRNGPGRPMETTNEIEQNRVASDQPSAESVGMILQRIPPATFTMGSPAYEAGRETDEGPVTQVTIDYEYWIGKYEVTQGQLATIADNPSIFNGDRTSWKLADYGYDTNRPVDNITWQQATDFCQALTLTQKKRIPTHYEYRLPTEAEWEYACRAGTRTKFSFGSDYRLLGNYAWYKPNSDGMTHPVGKKQPNPWGLYDMHGNVMEWCYDWYQTNLLGGSVTNLIGPANGTKRVLRGGGWASDEPSFFRCADRFGLEPSTNGWGYGFRVVLGPAIESLRHGK